jgi:hypothetical protein
MTRCGRVTSTALLFALIVGSSVARADVEPPGTLLAVASAGGWETHYDLQMGTALVGAVRAAWHPWSQQGVARAFFVEVETRLAWPIIGPHSAPRPAASASVGALLSLDEHWELLATLGPELAYVERFSVDVFDTIWEVGATASAGSRCHLGAGLYVELRAVAAVAYGLGPRFYPGVNVALGWAWRPRYLEPPPS